MKQQRICIYPNDVQLITGKSERQSRRIISNLQNSLGKEPDQLLTCCELGAYLNLDPEVIFKIINNLPLLEEKGES